MLLERFRLRSSGNRNRLGSVRNPTSQLGLLLIRFQLVATYQLLSPAPLPLIRPVFLHQSAPILHRYNRLLRLLRQLQRL